MKKRIAIFTAVIFTVLCFMNTMAFAAGPNYCSDCGAKMVEYAEHLGNWTEKHSTGNGDCTIYCSAYRIGYRCTSCGYTITKDEITRTHTNPACGTD